MKRKELKKILFIVILLFAVLFIFQIKSNAASISLSTSKSSVSPGENFSVTVSVSGGAGYVNLSASNASLSSTSIDLMLQSSATVTCTAGSSGNITISASGVIADYITEEDENKSTSRTVTITTPFSSGSSSGSSSNTNTKPVEVKKSSDSKLTSLSVAEGAISPEFSSNVKEYTLSVPNEITEINVEGTPSHSKATFRTEGNTNLQVGENKVSVIVTAEDNTTTTYTITVTRARAEVALQSIKVSFTDENGVITELPLEPLFSFDIFEYTLQKLAYTVKALDIEALANLEGATIKIEGNDNLQEGENKITITVTMPAEMHPETGEVLREEEIKTYTLIVEKEATPVPPTFWQKIGNWFKGIGGWIGNNAGNIQQGSLMFCSVAMFALSIYLIVDYKKYKTLLAKLKQLTEINSTTEPVQENSAKEKANNIIENEEIESNENIEEEQKKKAGRHF